MSLYFFVAAGVLIAVAIPLLFYILATEASWNFQKVWDAAIGGHKPSRWYLGLVLSAFALAVIGQMLAIGQQREKKAATLKAQQLLEVAASKPWNSGR
jgi:hypothetical protein